MVLWAFSTNPCLYPIDDLILVARDCHNGLLRLRLLRMIATVSLSEIHEVLLHLRIKLKTDTNWGRSLFSKILAPRSIGEFVILPKRSIFIWDRVIPLLFHWVGLALLFLVKIGSWSRLIVLVRGILEIKNSNVGHIRRINLDTVAIPVVMDVNLLNIQYIARVLCF